MDKNFGGIVWTNHALQRLNERGIKQGDAWAVWNRPDESRYDSEGKGAWVYYKTFGDQRIEVVAKQDENKKWVILSVWSKQVFGNQKQKKSLWKVLFGGYTDILLPLVASTLFIITFSISLLLPDDVINTSPTATPFVSPSVIITPSPSPTSSPSPTAKPIQATATPGGQTTIVTASTTAPVVNNAPPGSGYSRQSVQTDAGVFTVSLVAANMGSTTVIVDTASASDCASNCPALSLADYVTRNGGWAGINGTYFCPKDYPSCAGKENTFDLLVMNKDKYYFNSANNVYSNNPTVIFGAGYIRFVQAGSEWGRDTGVNGVLMNYPLLVFNSNIAFGGDSDPKKGSKGARSFVANKGSTVYIGVVHSATVAEAARALKALGMDNGLNLDNGGSTALYHGGYKVGPGRAIPNAIIFK